ncbi:MAG: hypothetical protein WBV77_14785 [Solirubrobacteraceae bacterium]
MQARLDDAQRRLNEHPGYREYIACEELARTVNAILVRNLDELLALLARPTWDQALAVELFQNMYRPDAREAYEAAVTQRLHNYVAGAATLVDHARRLMKGRTGTIAEEFEGRKAEVIANPEVPFIKDLRNFVLHQAHPFLGHTVRIHGQLMVRLHNQLHNELAEANTADLEDANRLVVERNAILGDMDPEAAKRLTEAITKLRESPTPIKTDDLPDALGSQG